MVLSREKKLPFCIFPPTAKSMRYIVPNLLVAVTYVAALTFNFNDLKVIAYKTLFITWTHFCILAVNRTSSILHSIGAVQDSFSCYSTCTLVQQLSDIQKTPYHMVDIPSQNIQADSFDRKFKSTVFYPKVYHTIIFGKTM